MRKPAPFKIHIFFNEIHKYSGPLNYILLPAPKTKANPIFFKGLLTSKRQVAPSLSENIRVSLAQDFPETD